MDGWRMYGWWITGWKGDALEQEGEESSVAYPNEMMKLQLGHYCRKERRRNISPKLIGSSVLGLPATENSSNWHRLTPN